MKKISANRKAHFNYELLERFEAGLVLQGWEVKSIRSKSAQISDSHVIVKKGEVFWVGGVIQPLLSTSTHLHPDPSRSRKLLLHSKEIRKLIGLVERKGYTLIPLSLYWKNNCVKLTLSVACGKKNYDKRADLKNKDWQREQERLRSSQLKRRK
jgi:SsrA-binding protein